MARCFPIVVIVLPSRETPVECGFYRSKKWDEHDDILLVLPVIALWATNKIDAMLIVYKMWEVCNNSTLA